MAGQDRHRPALARAACIAGFLLVAGLAAASDMLAPGSDSQAGSNTAPPGIAAETPASAASGIAAKEAVKQVAPAPKAAPRKSASPRRNPRWNELTPAQQQALAPLAPEWDKLEPARKSKWLAIGDRYAAMTADEQQRAQGRMRDWVGLSPEERKMARESYAHARKLDPDQKSAQWKKYQQLTPEQKDKLAADAAEKKRITTLPSAAQSKGQTVGPIKSTPKPVLEKSVTPQAAKHSPLRATDSPAE